MLINRVHFITAQIILATYLSPFFVSPILTDFNFFFQLWCQTHSPSLCYIVGRPTSLHFGTSLRPTASLPRTLAQIPTQLREQSSAVDDQKEHLMSDQCLKKASLILQNTAQAVTSTIKWNEVTEMLTKKSGDYRGMQQILLSAHHEPSWTPSVLICSHRTGLNLEPCTCPPATHSTSECCYGTWFFLLTYWQNCTVLCSHGVMLLLSLKTNLSLSV